jgi:hypothetical protein
MFRIATECVERPTIFFICDDKKCGCIASAILEDPAPGHDPEQVRANQMHIFVQAAQQNGWTVALDGHLCPVHTKKIAEQRKLVTIANDAVLRSLAHRN